MRHMTEYSPAKTGEYLRIFPNFQNCTRCEKHLKNNKHNSLHLGENMLRYLSLDIICFFEAHSFPRATLSDNCSLLVTDNIRGQISMHIFALNVGYCLYIPLKSVCVHRLTKITSSQICFCSQDAEINVNR